MEQKIEKNFAVFQIITFYLGVANSQNLEQHTCNQQSICSQRPVRFHLVLWEEAFSNSTSRRMRKNMTKFLSGTFYKYLGPFHMFSVKACSLTMLLGEWSKQDIDSL